VTYKQNQHNTDQKKEPDHAPVVRCKQAQREFVKVAGRFDLDPDAKARGTELRQEMKSPHRKSQEAQV